MIGPRYILTPYQKKLFDMDYQKHVKRLDSITKAAKKRAEEEEKEKALRSTSYDLRTKHLQFHTSEKIVAIDKDNQLLLDKLVKISRNGKAAAAPILNKTTSWVTHPGTLNTIYRKKELEKIAVENEAMAKRLISQHGSFDRRWMDNEFSKHLGLLKKVQKMPSPGLEKLSPLRTPMSAGNPKEFKIRRKKNRKNKRRAIDELGSGKSVQDVEPIKEASNADEEPQVQSQRESQPNTQNEPVNMTESQPQSQTQPEAQTKVEEDKSKQGPVETQPKEEEKALEKPDQETLSKNEVKEQVQEKEKEKEKDKEKEQKSGSQEILQAKTEPQEQKKKEQVIVSNDGRGPAKRTAKKAGTIHTRPAALETKLHLKKRVSSLSQQRHGSATSLKNETVESKKQETKQEEKTDNAAANNKEEDTVVKVPEAQEENKNVDNEEEEEQKDDADAESEKVDIPEIEESSNSQDDIPASSDRTQQQQQE